MLTVLAAIDQLTIAGFAIEKEAIYSGIKNTKKNTGLLGRWEQISSNPALVVDVAHNPEGIEQVLLQLKHTSYDKLHLIMGMVKDKDCERVLSSLPMDAKFYFTQAQLPRAMPSEELAYLASKKGIIGSTHAHVNDAINEAKQNATAKDLILVCGSIFLVAEVDRKYWTR